MCPQCSLGIADCFLTFSLYIFYHLQSYVNLAEFFCILFVDSNPTKPICFLLMFLSYCCYCFDLNLRNDHMSLPPING